jgi:uncharacterized protein YecT (DUF1311 family)
VSSPGCHWSPARLGAMPRHQTPALVALLAAAALMVVPTAANALSRHPDYIHSASAISAPVVTEDFKPVLPCNQNTTIGQEGCGEHEVVVADKELNADVKIIFDLLGKASDRAFVTAQTTWATYRNEDCTSQADIYQGGTEMPVAYVYCLASDDASRRGDLKAFFASLTQGMVHVPKFP